MACSSTYEWTEEPANCDDHFSIQRHHYDDDNFLVEDQYACFIIGWCSNYAYCALWGSDAAAIRITCVSELVAGSSAPSHGNTSNSRITYGYCPIASDFEVERHALDC